LLSTIPTAATDEVATCTPCALAPIAIVFNAVVVAKAVAAFASVKTEAVEELTDRFIDAMVNVEVAAGDCKAQMVVVA